MIEIVVWFIWAYLTMGLSEYLIHKYLMHKRFFRSKRLNWVWFNHAVLHHKKEHVHHNIDLPVYYHYIIGLPLILLLIFTQHYVGLVAFLGICHYHSWAWTVCHRAIHDVKGHWIEGTAFYRKIKQHHEGHHEHPNRNFNVVCLFPFSWDWIFRTKI